VHIGASFGTDHGQKNGMGRKGHRMGRKGSDSLGSDYRYSPKNEDESCESSGERGAGTRYSLEVEYGTTLLNSWQDYGLDNDQEKPREIHSELKPEPEENLETNLAPFGPAELNLIPSWLGIQLEAAKPIRSHVIS